MNLAIEKRSFFITEKLKRRSFIDFMQGNWNSLDPEEKKKILSSLGRFIRKIHNARISMPDLYLWHIFIEQNPAGEYEFAVIDLHRMKLNVKNNRTFARDLGAFDFSLAPEYFDDDMRKLLVTSYMGDDCYTDEETLWRGIKARSTVLNERRTRDY